MKKSIIGLLFISMTVGLFYACKKNNETVQTNGNNNTEQQYTEYEWEVYHKLEAYKQKKNSSFKSNDPITLDSAEWYLDTQFNVEEARTEYPYIIEDIDSAYFTLTLNGSGMANISDMGIMYVEIVDYVNSIIANPESIPIFGHLELLESDNDEAEFMFRLGIGSYINGEYTPFYYDWKFGNMLGDCAGNQVWLSDAGQELKFRINHPHFATFPPGSFIGNPEIGIVRYFNEDGTTNPDLYLDTDDEHPQSEDVNYFYYYEENNISTYEPCLEIEELDFYLDKAHEIIYTRDNENLPGSTIHYGLRPEGLTFESFTLDTPNGYNNYTNKYYWTHRYYIYYRLRVNIPIHF